MRTVALLGLAACAGAAREPDVPVVSIEPTPVAVADDAEPAPRATRTTAAPGDPRARAEQLFVEARHLMQQGRYDEACRKLTASLRLDAAVGTMLNLAGCEERIGHKPAACRLYRQVAARSAAAGQPDRAQAARERASKLGCK